MSYGERILKNAAWLVLATTLNKILAFVVFYTIARLMGPTVTGTYFYGVSVTSVFVILSDLGMTPVLIRAFAGTREDSSRLFAAALRAKAVLAPIAIVVALGYGYLSHVDSATLATIAIACLVMTADTFHLALYGVLRGKQNLKIEALGMFLGQIATGCAAVAAAFLHLGAPGLAAALLVGSAWNVLWAIKNVRSLQIQLGVPERSDYRRLFHEAIPFGISGVATKVYSYLDSLLLHAYFGATTVGIYAVAYKMTYALQFLPITLSAAVYPALAAAWARKDAAALRQTVTHSMRLLAFIGSAAAAALSALAPQIISVFYGTKYADSVASLEILPWVLLPIFMDFPVGSLLNATHRAHLKTTAMVVTMVVNAVLNIALVPALGPVGASLAGVCSFWLLFFVGVYFMYRDVGGLFVVISIVARALVLGGISWLVWRWAGASLPLFVALTLGGATALVCGFALKIITAQDARFVLRMRTSQHVDA